MAKNRITAHVKMDYKTLRAFSLFDTFLLKKAWRRPAIFGGIFLISAIICFCLTGKEQNVFMGVLLSIIGLGMPLVYVMMFLSGVKQQAKKLKLPRRVYTLAFSPSGIHITNDLKPEEAVDLEWSRVHALYRRKDAIYLYAAPTRAFILPNGQADATPDELWQMVTERAKAAKGQ